MVAADVLNRVNRSIGDASCNAYGWNFRQFLLEPPELREYRDDRGQPWTLWTVLLERNRESGYHVVYDPDDDEFGLASGGVVVGFYGDFMDAINGM